MKLINSSKKVMDRIKKRIPQIGYYIAVSTTTYLLTRMKVAIQKIKTILRTQETKKIMINGRFKKT